ncbi:hypothetical protein R1flu_015272 [Riccia fluitans]|uniref:Myb-like domain-containing protein n=1 Tax=Riccia fluitans TaxID=41844 RepID=A0ABD1YIF6_9MARC
MANFVWKADESIELLNVVQKWDSKTKDSQMRGKKIAMWQGVAAELFVPEDEADLYRLSKRCERRFNLLRNKYEAYCLQLAMSEENPSLTPPPHIKLDAELWEKMKMYFGDPQFLKSSKTPKLAVARVLAASVKKVHKGIEAEDDESSGSEEEPEPNESGQKLQLHEDSSSSSTSSVGSNNFHHDSAGASSPTSSSRTSYYEFCSSDSYTQKSDGSGQSAGRLQNYQPLWKDIDSFTCGSLSKSPSGSYDFSDSNWDSSSKDCNDNIAYDQMLAVTRTLSISKFSSRSEPKTTSSRAEFKNLIDLDDLDDHISPILGSEVIPSAAAAVADTVLNSLSPLNALKISSAAAAAVAVTPAAPPQLVECGRSPPSKLSLGSNTSERSKKKGEKKDSDSRMSPATGSKTHSVGSQDTSVVKSASGEQATKRQLEHSLSSSSKSSREMLVYNNQNLSHHLQRLPAIVGDKSMENPPNDDADSDGHRVLLSDEDRKKLMYEDVLPAKSKSTSSSSSTAHHESQDGRSGSRKSSASSSSSSSQQPSSGPRPSTSITTARDKDDNVNVMVYIKLNNLKISEPGHG